MSLETLKKRLVATIDDIEDEILLQEALDVLSIDKFDKNEIYYRKRLEEAIQQADAGKVLPSEDVSKMVKEWLIK